MGQDKDSLTGRGKAMHASEAKQGIALFHCFPWAGRNSAMPRIAGPHHP